MQKSYVLHGLRLSANRDIPGLLPAESGESPDLRVWIGESPFSRPGQVQGPGAEGKPATPWFETQHRTESGEPTLTATCVDGGRYYRITYRDGMDFVISGAADQVWVSWPPERSEWDVPSYLLGPIIGVILRLRAVTCLHASAVDFGGVAVMFIGPKGAGKSTSAATFAAHGFPVLADDTVGIDQVDGTWMATPGYPRIRLWPESAEALPAETRTVLLPPGESGSYTRYHLDLSARPGWFQPKPLPLVLIYLLEGGEEVTSARAETVAPAEALVELVTNTYATKILTPELRAREFDLLGRLAESIPLRKLWRPRQLDLLPTFREFILDDLERLGIAASLRASC